MEPQNNPDQLDNPPLGSAVGVRKGPISRTPCVYIKLPDSTPADQQRKHLLCLQLFQFHDRPWTGRHERKRLEELYTVFAETFHEIHPDYPFTDVFYVREVLFFVLGVVACEKFIPGVRIEGHESALEQTSVSFYMLTCGKQIFVSDEIKRVVVELYEIALEWQVKKTTPADKNSSRLAPADVLDSKRLAKKSRRRATKSGRPKKMIHNINIGRRIEQYRLDHDITIPDFADMFKTTPRTMQKIRLHGIISEEMLLRVIKKMGISREELLGS